jgi:trehalose-6-phosphate synthase
VRRKLVVVSNRGPVTFARDGSVRRSSGGLATALRSLLQYHDVTWIASAMTEADLERAGETLEQDAYRLRLVAHDPQAYDWYYNVVANPMLWFIQHSLWSTLPSTTPGARATRRSTRTSRRPSSPSSSATPTPPSSSTTTTCTSRRGWSVTSAATRH